MPLILNPGTVPIKKPDSQEMFDNFLGSALSSAGPELLGFDALPGAEKYRRDNPWLGMGSQMVGLAVPYTGWFKAAKGIGALAKGVEIAEGLAGGRKAAPILSRAAGAVAMDAPFEVGRTLISLGTGDNTGKVATDAATNLALAGVFGGLGGAIAAGGRKVPAVPEIAKSVKLDDPIPLQLRELKRAKAAGEVTSPDATDYWVNRYSDFVRREVPHKLETDGSATHLPFLNKLEGGKDTSRLDRLFRQSNGKELKTKRYVPEDFSSDASYTDALAKSGLMGQEEYIQFPRRVVAAGKKVNEVEATVRSTLEQIAPDTWMGKEAHDGLYVIAKRVEQQAARRATKGVAGRPEAAHWVMFKTDTPGRFAPLGDAWSSALTKVAKWAPDPLTPIDTPINSAMQKMIQEFPLQNYNDTIPTGKTGAFLADYRQKLGLDRLNGAAKQAAQHTYNFAKAHVAPAMFQFSKSPRAAYIFNVARNVFQFADAEAKQMMEGTAKIGADQNLFHHVLKGPETSGMKDGLPAIGPMIDKLTEEELGHVWLARSGMWDPKRVHEAVISGEITPAAGEAIKVLDAVDAKQFGDVMKTQEALGLNVSKPQIGHMMISNTWRGTIRVPVLDADGKLVILASGRNRAEAMGEADAMIEGAKKNGFNWKVGESFHADPTNDLQALLNGARNTRVDLGSRQFQLANALRQAEVRKKLRPTSLRENKGVSGYIGQYTPWTRQELKDLVSSHIHGYQRYQATMNVEAGLQSELTKLMSEDPEMYKQVMARMDDLKGKPSASSQLINRMVDATPLGSILGKDSASKLVATANSITHHLQLGLGNISFPLINALQPLSTTLPHLAFVLRASPEDMARAGYYSWNLAGDVAGKPKTGAGFLNMARLAGKSFEEMGKPSNTLQAHLAQAAQEGAWSGTFNNEVIGPNAAIGDKLRNAIEGKDGLAGMLSQWSNWLPNVSERFARVQAFTLGHIVGRDMLNLQGDDLYRFAKRFTENSSFAYSTADRARVITGPLGTLAGLYKNWQMHYIGWMLNYIGQGVKQGNWAPLIYQTLGTGMTGGIGSMAGYGVLDGLSSMLTDKGLMQHVYSNFGPSGSDTEGLSDAVYFGLPAFLGTSLQTQASAPGANPVRDAAMLFSLVQWDRMKALGTAVGNAWDQYDATGENPMHSPLVRDNVLRAVAPRSLYRAMATTEAGVIRSMTTGNANAKASIGERVLYAIGLNPVDVEKQMVVSDRLWRDQDAMRNAVQAYGKAMVAAEGDPDAMRAVMLRAMADGVPLDSVIRSSKARQSKSAQTLLERQFKPIKVKGYEDVLPR